MQPALVFIVVTVVGMLTATASWYTIDQTNRMSFAAIAEDALQRLGDRLENHMLLLTATEALFEVVGEVPEARQFKIFIEQMQKTEQFEGVQGIGFARYVETGAQSDAAVSTELQRSYGIARGPWPETEESHRTPIVLLEPETDRNRRALAYDMYSEPVRRAAMLAALTEQRLRASGAVELVQENGDDPQAGFLMYKPFFAIDTGQPLGFVYAPFRIGDLFDSALNRVPVLPIHVTAWDGEPSDTSVIYQSIGVPGGRGDGSYTIMTAMEVAGRTWSLKIDPSASYQDPVDQTRSYMLVIVTLLLAGALAASSRSQQRTIEVGEALRLETERALADREFLLQEMKHRIKNMIARVAAIARQTSRASETLPEFTDSFTARLQAMAASQDLLARTAWQGADLKTLLSRELTQLFGDDLDAVTLSGPKVELNEAASQAFGLAIHELATNALKYGSARHQTGTLHIEWKVKRPRKAPSELFLKWSESSVEPLDTGNVDALVGKGGFGTKLLDATMRVELGGSIETEPNDHGIQVTIRVPHERVTSRRRN